MTPFILTLEPGRNIRPAAQRAAEYIIDRWMPGNAGGVHLLLGGQLRGILETMWQGAVEAGRVARIRVSVKYNRPVLELLDNGPLPEMRL